MNSENLNTAVKTVVKTTSNNDKKFYIQNDLL